MEKIGIKKLTRETSILRAVGKVWRAGLDSLRKKDFLDKLTANNVRLEREHLEMSRLVHEYETKLHNLVRHNAELVQKNKELEWAFRALQRENHWMREELFTRKRSAAKK